MHETNREREREGNKSSLMASSSAVRLFEHLTKLRFFWREVVREGTEGSVSQQKPWKMKNI